MSDLPPEQIVQRFAQALDRNDFPEAERYLSTDCVYLTGSEVLRGPQAILASYAQNAKWAEQALERVVYESRVETMEDGKVKIHFTDRILQGQDLHEYRCDQVISLNAAGQIARIVQEELTGEREKLNEFFSRHGISR